MQINMLNTTSYQPMMRCVIATDHLFGCGSGENSPGTIQEKRTSNKMLVQKAESNTLLIKKWCVY